MRRLFRGRAAAGGGMLSAAALAPLVDMLTILLVVILRTWSVEAPPQLPEDGFALPVSRSEEPVQRGVIVDVAANGLYVDGWRAGSTRFYAKSEQVLVREVYEALQARGGSRVEIRADREAPWSVVGKVLFTAQQAGFEDVQLVAVSRASL